MLGVLLMSFGGPNGPDEVRPFLTNVATGRRIPPARLEEVAHHYLAFGGVSPINQRNAELVAALAAAFADRDISAQVVVGNRNWLPYFDEALVELVAAGCERIVLLPSSVYEAFSTCRQYRQDLAAAMAKLAARGISLAEVELFWAEPAWATDSFVAAATETVAAEVEAIPTQMAGESGTLPEARANRHVIFVTHSIPVAMDLASGRGHTYAEQTRWVAAQIASRLGLVSWSVAYCSRSGPPQIPWLEPDICDETERLAGIGVTDVVVAPIGFINDHMEVIYDLDTEASAVAAKLGLGFRRAATVGVTPLFIDTLVTAVLTSVPIDHNCCAEN